MLCACWCVGLLRCGVKKEARVLTRDWRSRARRAKRPHDVLPHPRQGAIGRGGRKGGRELADRGAVVNAVASRWFCSGSSLAPASERKRERGREEEKRREPNRFMQSQCLSMAFILL